MEIKTSSTYVVIGQMNSKKRIVSEMEQTGGVRWRLRVRRERIV